MELGKLGVWYFLEGMAATAAAEAAQRIESLGYSALWIPETAGRNPLVHASWLLANTSKLIVATGIANIYHREPGVTVGAQKALAEQSDNRFLLGLGVSHKPFVEGVRGLVYRPPVATMEEYLGKMAAAPYQSVAPSEDPPTVIAALGPKMLQLARDQCAGAHPYFVSPNHTAFAREILGPDKLLCVEQKVILGSYDSFKVSKVCLRFFNAKGVVCCESRSIGNMVITRLDVHQKRSRSYTILCYSDKILITGTQE